MAAVVVVLAIIGKGSAVVTYLYYEYVMMLCCVKIFVCVLDAMRFNLRIFRAKDEAAALSRSSRQDGAQTARERENDPFRDERRDEKTRESLSENRIVLLLLSVCFHNKS